MKKSDIWFVLLLMALMIMSVSGLGWFLDESERTEDTGVMRPALSAESGFYEEPFELSITVPEGTEVYYTLDGSIPTMDSLRYTDPVTITYGGGWESAAIFIPNVETNWLDREGESHPNSATVIRAAAVNEHGTWGDVVTATYFVGENGFREKLVVSLVADPEDLFGENGIYVTGKAYDDWYLNGQEGERPIPNFLQHGKAWERPAVLELFAGDSFLQQSVGIRIQGASAREVKNKRFSVYARKEYSGSNWFDVPLFGEGRTHSFVLRSGFMNGYIQHLVRDRDVASAESREVIVYLNGAEWYITFAQEKYSGKYFQENYGVDDDNVIIAKGGVVDSEDAQDQALYQAIYDFLNTHDMSEETSYELLDQIIDIQSYIDFSCVNVYFANLDYSEYKNYFCWRARKSGYGEYEDGRWRWALYDMDLENLDYGLLMQDINTFTMDTHYAGSAFNTRPLYAALRQNPLFCRQFVISFMDMINTDFTVQRATEAMEDWGVTMIWWGMYPDWMENFFPARTEAVKGHLAEEFGLAGTCETVKLSVNHTASGYLTLNTIVPNIPEGGEWCGSYFTDYPVTVQAVPREGYRFVCWRSDSLPKELQEQESITVEIPAGGLALYAVFEKDK